MSFKDKEPIHIGPVTLPFLRITTQNITPEGSEFVQPSYSSLVFDSDPEWMVYRVDGENITRRRSNGTVYREEEPIPGPEVSRHPYLSKLLAYQDPKTAETK